MKKNQQQHFKWCLWSFSDNFPNKNTIFCTLARTKNIEYYKKTFSSKLNFKVNQCFINIQTEQFVLVEIHNLFEFSELHILWLYAAKVTFGWCPWDYINDRCLCNKILLQKDWYFGHNKMWRPSCMNWLSLSSRILWSPAITICGDHRHRNSVLV